jgi:hypothetical protein
MSTVWAQTATVCVQPCVLWEWAWQGSVSQPTSLC